MVGTGCIISADGAVTIAERKVGAFFGVVNRDCDCTVSRGKMNFENLIGYN